MIPVSNLPFYVLSNPNVICDVCGRKRKWSEVQYSYGAGDIAVVIACTDGCADERHPLNTPPPVIFDGQPIPDARPENSDTFVVVHETWDANFYTLGAPSEFSFDANNDTTWDNA